MTKWKREYPYVYRTMNWNWQIEEKEVYPDLMVVSDDNIEVGTGVVYWNDENDDTKVEWITGPFPLQWTIDEYNHPPMGVSK